MFLALPCNISLGYVLFRNFSILLANKYLVTERIPIDDFNSSNFCIQPTWITQCPLLLLDTRMPYGSLSVGCEEHLDPAGTGSFFNEGEAEIVIQHIFSLIYAGTCPSLLIFS